MPLIDEANETFCRMVQEELAAGYRGYQLQSCGVYRHPAKPSPRMQIFMFMDHSPMFPHDGMFIDSQIEFPPEFPEQFTVDCRNAIETIRYYIDCAYDKNLDSAWYNCQPGSPEANGRSISFPAEKEKPNATD